MLEPLAVRATPCKVALQFFVWNKSPLLEIDQEHPPRLEPPLGLDVFGVDREHTHLAGHDHPIIVREIIT